MIRKQQETWSKQCLPKVGICFPRTISTGCIPYPVSGTLCRKAVRKICLHRVGVNVTIHDATRDNVSGGVAVGKVNTKSYRPAINPCLSRSYLLVGKPPMPRLDCFKNCSTDFTAPGRPSLICKDLSNLAVSLHRNGSAHNETYCKRLLEVKQWHTLPFFGICVQSAKRSYFNRSKSLFISIRFLVFTSPAQEPRSGGSDKYQAP